MNTGTDGNRTAETIQPDPATEPTTSATVEDLQKLLLEARWYVYHFECSHQNAYDDQQALLEKIDIAAPPAPSSVFPQCQKDPACYLENDHQGDCDYIPF